LFSARGQVTTWVLPVPNIGVGVVGVLTITIAYAGEN